MRPLAKGSGSSLNFPKQRPVPGMEPAVIRQAGGSNGMQCDPAFFDQPDAGRLSPFDDLGDRFGEKDTRVERKFQDSDGFEKIPPQGHRFRFNGEGRPFCVFRLLPGLPIGAGGNGDIRLVFIEKGEVKRGLGVINGGE